MKPGNDLAVVGLVCLPACRSFAVVSQLSPATTLRRFLGASMTRSMERSSVCW
jgi:hypothetical protein